MQDYHWRWRHLTPGNLQIQAVFSGSRLLFYQRPMGPIQAITQRAISVTQRALSVTQRALSVTQRALSVTRRALSVTQEALSITLASPASSYQDFVERDAIRWLHGEHAVQQIRHLWRQPLGARELPAHDFLAQLLERGKWEGGTRSELGRIFLCVW